MVAKLGQGALLGKMDIKSAFRLLPINPSDFELLGFQLGDYFFYDKCLPFGCSISCATFEKFSSFLEWVVKSQAGHENVDHYLDDFLFAGEKNSLSCASTMNIFNNICSELGVPIAHDKTIWPTPKLTYVGLVIDTMEMKVRIPTDKLLGLKALLLEIYSKKKVTLKEMQKLAGSLSFCSRAIPSSRAFIRPFYDATIGVSKPHHFIRVTLALKEDIRFWLISLESFNGDTFYLDSEWLDSTQLQLFTDSAVWGQAGGAAYFQPHWIYVDWPRHWRSSDIVRDITLLELVPIVLAFHIWARIFRDRKIALFTDNKALVSILNKKSSKSKRVMHFVRPLVLQTMFSNIQIRAIHVPGSNSIADALSRRQWSRFRQLAPGADAEPAVIQESFLTLISTLR